MRPLLLLALLLVPAAARSAEPTLAVRWNDVLLECVRRSKLGPPMVARAIAEVHTCGYDAWAMYDDVALATRTGAELRRPPGSGPTRTERRHTATPSIARCSISSPRRPTSSGSR
jgi:hypothetical protein